jgi:hypothetical protein
VVYVNSPWGKRKGVCRCILPLIEPSPDHDNIMISDHPPCNSCGCHYRAFKDKETIEKYKILLVQLRLDRSLDIKKGKFCIHTKEDGM